MDTKPHSMAAPDNQSHDIWLTAPRPLTAGVQDDEGHVCGLATIPLLELMRGALRQPIHAPLRPHTTIRGAASLDWTTRPGNYVEVRSFPSEVQAWYESHRPQFAA